MRGRGSTSIAVLAVLSLIALLAPILLGAHTHCAMAAWDGPILWRQTVDPTSNTGKWTSCSFDSTGRPGIAYYDAANRAVKYAHWNGASWEKQVVQTDVGLWDVSDYLYVSLAYDNQDRPALAYYSQTAGSAKLNYAAWEGTSWDIETIDSSVGTALGLFPSLAFDHSGDPAISYCDLALGLKYACWDGSSWATEVVASGAGNGKYSSLAFDDIGGRGIAYYDSITGSLKYARWEGSSWSVETVEHGSNVGQFASLAYDASGHPHIAYYDGSNTAVKRAWYDDGSWHTAWLDGIGSGQSVGKYSSMVTHYDGGLSIAYYDETNAKGKIAHKDPGCAWVFYDLDTEAATGKFCSAAVGPNDEFGVSYYCAVAPGKLKFAFVDNSAPSVTLNNVADFVNSTLSIGGAASDDVAIDGVQVRIKDSTTNQYWNGTSWQADQTWLGPDTHSAAWDTWSYASSSVNFVDGNTYTLGARANDALGRVSAVCTDAFVFDSTPPTVTIDDIDDFVTSLASMSGTASDTLPGQPERVRLRIMNLDTGEYWSGTSWYGAATWLDATGTASWSYSTAGVAWVDGHYSVTVTSMDKAGNVSTPASDDFTYDTGSPTVTLDDIADFVNSLTSVSGGASDALGIDSVQVQIYSIGTSRYWNGSEWQAAAAWLDATGTTAWAYNATGVDWADGSYRIRARSIDMAGNISTEAEDTFLYDSTRPTATIDDIADYVDSLDSLSGTAADAGGLDRVQIQIQKQGSSAYWDGSQWQATAAWLAAVGTSDWTYSLPALGDDTYTVSARAMDKASNISLEVTDSFAFDTAEPTVTLDDIADFVSSLSSIGGTAADDPPGQLAKVQVQIENVTAITYWSGAAWVADPQWLDASGTASWTYDMPFLQEAEYMITARCLDMAGHASELVSESFTLDATSPAVTLNSIPAFANVAPTVTGTSEDSYSGVEQVRVLFRQNDDNRFWDGGSWQDDETWLTCTGTDFWGYGSSSVGWSTGRSYTVRVKAIDRAGNESTEASDSFIYDTTRPTVSLADITDFVDTLASVSGTASDAAPGELHKVQVRISNTRTAEYWDGTAWQATAVWLDAAGTAAWSYDISGTCWPDSYYLVTARALDKAGNASTVATESFGYDATDPTVTLDDIPAFAGSVPSLSGTAADALGVDCAQVQLYEQSSETFWDGTAWQAAATWLDAEGSTAWTFAMPALVSNETYTVRAKAIDDSGRESAEVSTSFIYDATHPTASLDVIPNLVTALDSISGTASDTPPGELDRVQVQLRKGVGSYWDGSSWQSAPTWLDAEGATSWAFALPPLEDEDYKVSVRSVDRAGNLSIVASQTFTVDAARPTVSLDGVADFVNSLRSVTGTAADNKSGVAVVSILIKDQSAGTYWDGDSWEATPAWVECSGTESWSYDTSGVGWVGAHSYKVTVTATDNAGNAVSSADRPSDTFCYDTTIPTVALDDIPDLVSPPASVSGTADDTTHGQVETVQVQVGKATGSAYVYWSGSDWVTRAVWVDAEGTGPWSFAMPSLDSGDYTLRARSLDRAGNISAEVADSFTCDAAVPTVAIDEIGALLNSLSTVSGTAVDTPPGELEKVQVQVQRGTTCWDGSTWQGDAAWLDAIGTGTWTFAMPKLGDGNYTVKARAVDTAGNLSSQASDAFSIDTSPPQGYGPVAPGNNTTNVSLRPLLTSSVAADVTCRPVVVLEETYEYYLFQVATDDSFSEGLQQSQWQAEETWTPPVILTPGTTYYWRVRVKDDLGNEGGWSSVFRFSTALATVVTEAEGGQVSGIEGRVNLSLSPGAVSGDVQMCVLPLDAPPGEPPDGFALGATFFTLEAFDANGIPLSALNEACTIVVEYHDEDLAAAEGQPRRLYLARWDEAAERWQLVLAERDADAHTAIINTASLGTWGFLIGPLLPEAIAAWARVAIVFDGLAILGLCGLVVWRRLAPFAGPDVRVTSDGGVLETSMVEAERLPLLRRWQQESEACETRGDQPGWLSLVRRWRRGKGGGPA
ncbi:MAG: hypothetical protein DRI39_06320, partial [Chloroflexi bacterium]